MTSAWRETAAATGGGWQAVGGFFDMIRGFPGASPPPYCDGKDFRTLFAGFIDSFVTHVHSQGLSSAPLNPSVVRTLPPSILPAAARLVAIGDLHGDLDKCKRAFRLGGLTDEEDRWIGGTTVAVQVGDILDRGDDEVAINYWLERLEREAMRAGGALYILNGNHEIINAGGRFTYATPAAAVDFLRWKAVQHLGAGLKANCRCQTIGVSEAGTVPSGSRWAGDAEWEPRAAAVSPGGPFTRRFFAHRPVALQIGSSVFVHGGLLPDHVESGLEQLNQDASRWLRGDMPKEELQGRAQPPFLSHRDSPVWTRQYSNNKEQDCSCETLAEALSALPGAQRMIVGHTIQTKGINSACEGRVYRIDVGMSEGCSNASPEVLEIRNDSEVYRLREGAPPEVLAGQSETRRSWLFG